MVAPPKYEHILRILRAAEFAQLIGLVENDDFDGKSQPYQLDQDRGRLELAKDVAGFAEQHGGLILIGVETARSPLHFGEEIKRLRPMPKSLIDTEQYHAIIKSWVHPAPEGVSVEFFPIEQDSDKGVFSISIPEQAADKKPFVVVHTVLDDGRRRDFVLGYVKRWRADVEPTTPRDLQRLLRDGLRFDDLNRRVDALTEQVRALIELPSQQASPPLAANVPSISAQEFETRIAAATLAGSLEGPTFALTATPLSKLEMRGLFGSRHSPTVKLLDNPPEIRPHGFGIGIGTSSHLVGNQLRRAVMPGWHLLELWRDGVLIYIASPATLTWGREYGPRWGLLINPLALCEMVYLFVDLTRALYAFANPAPAGVSYRISLRRFAADGKPTGLRRHISSFPDVHTAPGDDFSAATEWGSPQIDSEVIAFRLVAEVFRWFTFDDSEIPYARERDDGEMMIDPELIKAASRSPAQF